MDMFSFTDFSIFLQRTVLYCQLPLPEMLWSPLASRTVIFLNQQILSIPGIVLGSEPPFFLALIATIQQPLNWTP